MSDAPASLELSPKVREVLASIAESGLRDRVTGAIARSVEALAALRRVHLPQDEFELRPDPSPDPEHLELAPYVLAAVAATNRLIAFLMDQFEPPASATAQTPDADDFDLEFDLIDTPGGQGGLSSRKASPERALSPSEAAADAAHAFGGMLRSRVVSFGERLGRAHAAGDGWMLLSELDDYKHGLEKSVQGVLFGVLGVFNNRVTREEILPEYRSAVTEAVALRAAVVDLAYHVGRFNESLGDPDIALPLMVALSDRLTRFASQPVYRSMRAEDKKAVMDFRRELYELRHGRKDGGVQTHRLRLAVEGFSKFLEAMHAINHREALVLHDRRLIELALQELGQVAQSNRDETLTRATLTQIVHRLTAICGRNPDIDAAVREYSRRTAHPAVSQELPQWAMLLQQTATMVG